MWSSLDSSPYEVGLWRLKQHNDALAKQDGSIVNLEFEGYPENEWIEELYAEDAKPELLGDFAEKFY